MLAKPSFFIRFASRASIRWLRDADRPPRRSLSNELLIARGTPPNPGGEFGFQAPHKCSNSSLPSREGTRLWEVFKLLNDHLRLTLQGAMLVLEHVIVHSYVLLAGWRNT